MLPSQNVSKEIKKFENNPKKSDWQSYKTSGNNGLKLIKI